MTCSATADGWIEGTIGGTQPLYSYTGMDTDIQVNSDTEIQVYRYTGIHG